MELLMIILIVGILAALLLTGYSQVKARAQRIQCANNLNQIGLALQEFKTDHSFYPAEVDPIRWDEERNWRDALGNEMSIHHNVEYYPQGVWQCPATHRPLDSFWALHKNWGYNDYGYNVFGLGSRFLPNSMGLAEHWFNLPNTTAKPGSRVNEVAVADPSEMFAIGDEFFGGPDIIEDGLMFARASDSVITAEGFPGYDSTQSTRRAYARHQGKANVVFCDGHVGSPTLKFLFADLSDEALSCWNRDHLPHRERLSP